MSKLDPTLPAKAAVAEGRHLPAPARVVLLLALLWVFLFAIALMGMAFKAFGKDFSEALIASTTNPVIGLMIGLLATSVIQSSSGTTSIVVGMVAAGALTVSNAVPIIMGANMGTTVTNTLVAMGSMGRRAEFRRAFAGATMHDFFNLLTICVLFPVEQATHFLERTAHWLSEHLVGTGSVEFQSPVNQAVKPAAKAFAHWLETGLDLHDVVAGVGMLVVSLVALFFALTMLTRLMRRVVVSRARGAFAGNLAGNGLLGMALGTAVTVLVQSSSITTSLLVPLIGAGLIPMEGALAVTLGANIGTTVTALLASLAGNPAAVTVALVHLLFNVTGILIFYPYPPLRRVPVRLARLLALRTSRNRWVAVYYMLGVFFLLPLVFVLISRVLNPAS
ncbi:MAG TPA: Na/Pi symporter [Candidatus Krumholzibacteria bacterium]|nr:Na/Pi symporter [Candidatus Krumholzibacteria bacterium]